MADTTTANTSTGEVLRGDRVHACVPGTPLFPLLLDVLDRDAIGFVLTSLFSEGPLMRSFLTIDTGEGRPMSMGYEPCEVDLPTLLDTLQATPPCPEAAPESFMAQLRADVVGSTRTGSVYADTCLHGAGSNTDVDAGVVRWHVSWSRPRGRLTVRLPHALQQVAAVPS